MIAPTVHLNGTSYEELLQLHQQAKNDLEKAIESLHAASPNARDYYVQPPGAYTTANEEHASSCEQLYGVLADVEQLKPRKG